MRDFLNWCWCWAISRFLLGEHEYLIFKRSDHIKGLVHVMCADDLTGAEVTEAVPNICWRRDMSGAILWKETPVITLTSALAALVNGGAGIANGTANLDVRVA